MTGAEHFAEAERLSKLAADMWMNPEGGYDEATPSAQELGIRQEVADLARAEATVVLAEAQVHATLALAAATAMGSTHLMVGDSDEITDWARLVQPGAFKPPADDARGESTAATDLFEECPF